MWICVCGGTGGVNSVDLYENQTPRVVFCLLYPKYGGITFLRVEMSIKWKTNYGGVKSMGN